MKNKRPAAVRYRVQPLLVGQAFCGWQRTVEALQLLSRMFHEILPRVDRAISRETRSKPPQRQKANQRGQGESAKNSHRKLRSFRREILQQKRREGEARDGERRQRDISGSRPAEMISNPVKQ